MSTPVKFLVCADGSDNSFRAMQNAVKLAKKDDIIWLIIVTTKGQFDQPTAALRDSQKQELIASKLKRFQDYAKENAGEVDVRTQIVEGADPRGSLQEFAENHKVDFVVVGTRGNTGLKKMVMGSTADYLVRNSDIPVIVVK